jgi:aminoglycoside 3-N-acetyltransferase I
LIKTLRKLDFERGACGIFVQTETGVEDEPAQALYSKFGQRAEVLHFDIAVKPNEDVVVM